jgi:hypothetical protein
VRQPAGITEIPWLFLTKAFLGCKSNSPRMIFLLC